MESCCASVSAVRNNSGLESVDNALRLLLLLAERDQVRVSEVASELDIALSTAHRLLATLRARDFVEQGRDRSYSKGPAYVRLGGGVARPARPLEDVARPYLERLRDQVNETSHLSVLDGTEMRFLLSIESDQVLRVGSRVGARLPAHRTSGGKALLAALSPSELERRFPPRGLASLLAPGDDLERLQAELSAIARRGYGVNRGESERGVAAVGVGLLSRSREPVGAVSLSLPTVRLSSARLREMVAELLHVKEALEAELAA
jgi:IclR family transcriptional regulator, acetate operon repressor